MTGSSKRSAGLILGLAIGVSACSQPYDPPAVFDENFSSASNSTTEAPSQGFAGLADLAQMGGPAGATTLPARVMWTHGMCSPSDGSSSHDPYVWWQVRTRDLVAAYPGATLTGSPSIVALSPAGAQLIKETLSVPGKTPRTMRQMELWFLDWSPLTKNFKPRARGDIETDRTNPYSYERATLNTQLKQGLIKDCFVDVVVYLGPNGDRIRHDAQLAVCDMLDGTFNSETGCAGATGARFTALVSESLGSTILFDAFRSLRLDYVKARQDAIDRIAANAPRLRPAARMVRGKPSGPAPSSSTYSANMNSANSAMGRATANSAGVSAAMASLTNFYMLANQIPLINFAGREPPPLEEFVASASEMRKPTEGAAALTVVAFVDPNDLLSFRLIPKSDRGHVVNFVVSNADTYLGYTELPTYAHCNYVHNGYVMHAIVFGYAGGTPQSGAVDDPEPCF